MRIQVNDFMSHSVIAAQGTDSIGEIRAIMKRESIHAIPIVENSDGNILVQGIVTTTDLCCEVDDTIPVERVLGESKVLVLPTTTSAKSAAEMMLKHKVHHLVVMENGKLVGMVSSLDFVKLVSNFALEENASSV
jgi:CBS domain-containing protein